VGPFSPVFVAQSGGEGVGKHDPPVPREHKRGGVLDKYKRWLPRRSDRDRFPAIRFALATVIILIWCAIYIKAFTDPTFHVPEGLSGVAIAAATYLFGTGLLNSSSKKGEDDDESE
jgi:hypothetical protein